MATSQIRRMIIQPCMQEEQLLYKGTVREYRSIQQCNVSSNGASCPTCLWSIIPWLLNSGYGRKLQLVCIEQHEHRSCAWLIINFFFVFFFLCIPDFDLQLEDNTAVDGVIQQYSGCGVVWKAEPTVIPSNGGSSKPHVRPQKFCWVKKLMALVGLSGSSYAIEEIIYWMFKLRVFWYIFV